MYRLIFFFFAGLVLTFIFSSLNGQSNNQNTTDTIIIEPGQEEIVLDTSFHDPKKAMIYSAILPGLGQIYNRKVWKVPIIYAGFGTFVYFIDRNTKYYKDLKQAIIDYPDYNLKYFTGNFTEDQLTSGKDTYKRWRDLSYILTVGFYALQIIDASVDAYMFDWDVSPDISLRIEPSGIFLPDSPISAYGFRASLSF